MRHFRLFAAALFALLILPGASQAAVAPPASDLFVVRAAHGTAVSVGDDQFALELHGVDPRTIWFTDRPERAAGEHSTAHFVDAWHALGLDADPPNAAIVLSGGDPKADTMIVELTEPRYDRRTRTLWVKVRRLPTSTHVASGHERRADPKLPARFGRVSVFIDPAPTPAVTVTVVNQSSGALGLVDGSNPLVPVSPGRYSRSVHAANDSLEKLSGTVGVDASEAGRLSVDWSASADAGLQAQVRSALAPSRSYACVYTDDVVFVTIVDLATRAQAAAPAAPPGPGGGEAPAPRPKDKKPRRPSTVPSAPTGAGVQSCSVVPSA